MLDEVVAEIVALGFLHDAVDLAEKPLRISGADLERPLDADDVPVTPPGRAVERQDHLLNREIGDFVLIRIHVIPDRFVQFGYGEFDASRLEQDFEPLVIECADFEGAGRLDGFQHFDVLQEIPFTASLEALDL